MSQFKIVFISGLFVIQLLHGGNSCGRQEPKRVQVKAVQSFLLHDAVKRQDLNEIDRLIHEKASVLDELNGRHTPLSFAVSLSEKNGEIVARLIQAGANKSFRGSCGCSLLHIAAANNNLDAIKILLKNNVDPSLTDSLGRKAIDLARDPEIIKLLENACINYFCGEKSENQI